MYLIPYQSEINPLSAAFQIISFTFVNQELCHVLYDEAKSHFVPLFVLIVEIVMKVSNNETVFLVKQGTYKENIERNHRNIF